MLLKCSSERTFSFTKSQMANVEDWIGGYLSHINAQTAILKAGCRTAALAKRCAVCWAFDDSTVREFSDCLEPTIHTQCACIHSTPSTS